MLCDGDATGEKAAGSPSVYELLESIGVDQERFKRIVHDPHGQQSGDHVVVDQVISSVVNSGVDVDKLSYLTLDAYFTGVSYGSGLDIGTLLKGSTIARTDTGALHLSFTDRAIAALEDVVMTRYWNFRTIYWHHTNRAMMAMLLQVVRRLYAENGESSQYIYDTLWMSDYEALRYLDKQYASRFGRESMVHDLEKERGRIFRRLYTLHPQTDTTDRELYKVISKPTFSGERFRSCMANGLNEHLGDVLQGRSITQDDVLFDVPRRELDSGGDVYIADSGTGQTEPLARLSEPVRFLVENYNALAQRVRIFVAPWLAQTVGRRKRIDDRDKFQAIISAATKATSSSSEVR